MADIAALDDAISGLSDVVATISTAVDDIVAKLGEVPNVDFTPEVTKLTEATSSLQESSQNLADALAAPETEPPAEPV